jgi:hypothetical protein
MSGLRVEGMTMSRGAEARSGGLAPGDVARIMSGMIQAADMVSTRRGESGRMQNAECKVQAQGPAPTPFCILHSAFFMSELTLRGDGYTEL